MTSEKIDTDIDFQFVMRRTMEALAAPALACRQRSCRRHRRCTGSGPQAADYPCHRRAPRALLDHIVANDDLQSVITDHLLKGQSIDPLQAADPHAVATAVTLILRMFPKSRWRRLRRALARAGIASPLPSMRKPNPRRHKNAAR
jgi:hypothetical protein